ncbi:MAG: hypothetical protein IJ088_04745 [Clostridia bacterium]|nr:hypothetical protein [Clostridia bacterium]
MVIPADFRYRREFSLARPDLSCRHPEMDRQRRAKIFAPFDALSGFDEAIASKTVPYTDRPELSDEVRRHINHVLSELHRLIPNTRLARLRRVHARAIRFVPCRDRNSTAFGHQGLLEQVEGICRCVDPIEQRITIDDMVLSFDSLVDLNADFP